MVLLDMHPLPDVLGKHLATIGHKQSSEDIGPVFLHGLIILHDLGAALVELAGSGRMS